MQKEVKMKKRDLHELKFNVFEGWMDLPKGKKSKKIKKEIPAEYSAYKLALYWLWKKLESAGFSFNGIYHDRGFKDNTHLLHTVHAKKKYSACLILGSMVTDSLYIRILGTSKIANSIAKTLKLRDRNKITETSYPFNSCRG